VLYEIRWRGSDGTLHRGATDTARAAVAEVMQLGDDGYEGVEVEDTETHVVYQQQTMADLYRQMERRPV
jgi:hypothetical protein